MYVRWREIKTRISKQEETPVVITMNDRVVKAELSFDLGSSKTCPRRGGIFDAFSLKLPVHFHPLLKITVINRC